MIFNEIEKAYCGALLRLYKGIFVLRWPKLNVCFMKACLIYFLITTYFSFHRTELINTTVVMHLSKCYKTNFAVSKNMIK